MMNCESFLATFDRGERRSADLFDNRHVALDGLSARQERMPLARLARRERLYFREAAVVIGVIRNDALDTNEILRQCSAYADTVWLRLTRRMFRHRDKETRTT